MAYLQFWRPPGQGTAVVIGSRSSAIGSRTKRLPTAYCRCSVMLLEALCELLDIVRRPARHFHAEMQAHLGEHFLDLIQRLAAEIRRPQHLAFALLDQIADVNDGVVLQAVRRTH